MTTIYSRRSCFEAIPNLVAQLFRYRTRITEFLMQLLELVESRNHILFISQLFGSLAKMRLYFQILLEIIFAEFVV